MVGLDLRLAPLAVAVWVGALSGLYLGWSALWILLAVVLITAGLVAWIWWSKRKEKDWLTGSLAKYVESIANSVDFAKPVDLAQPVDSVKHTDFVGRASLTKSAGTTTRMQPIGFGKTAKFPRQPKRQQRSQIWYWWPTVVALIVGFGLSILTAAIHIERERNDLLSQAMTAEDAYIQVTGQISGMPETKESAWGQEYVNFQLSVDEVTWRNHTQQVSGKLIVQIRDSTSDNRAISQTGNYSGDAYADNANVSSEEDSVLTDDSLKQIGKYQWGDSLKLYGRITALEGVGELRGILTTLTVEENGQGNQFLQGVSMLKEQLAAVAKESGGSGWALIPGMGVGYDEVLDAADAEAMQTASLSHLTAVSGSHIALTVGMFAAITKPSRSGRALLGSIFMGLILVTVGPEPSVLRCVATGMIGAWGMAAAKGGQSLAALFAVIIGAILLQPTMAVSIGFQMSVAATIAILVPGRLLYQRFRQTNWLKSFGGDGKEGIWANLVRKLVDSLVQMLVISFVCALAVVPMLANLNDWQPTYGVLANLLAGFAVPMVTICALIAAGTVIWCEPIAKLACCVSTPFTAWILNVANWVSQLPGAKCPWPEGSLGVLAGFGIWVLLGAGLLFLHKAKFVKPQTLLAKSSQNARKNKYIIWFYLYKTALRKLCYATYEEDSAGMRQKTRTQKGKKHKIHGKHGNVNGNLRNREGLEDNKDINEDMRERDSTNKSKEWHKQR